MEATVRAKQPSSSQSQPPSHATSNPPATPQGWGRGTVQHVYPERGFGFIRCTEGATDDVGEDFFFHITALEGATLQELLPGTLVEFECRDVPRGKRAEHVSLV